MKSPEKSTRGATLKGLMQGSDGREDTGSLFPRSQTGPCGFAAISIYDHQQGVHLPVCPQKPLSLLHKRMIAHWWRIVLLGKCSGRCVFCIALLHGSVISADEWREDWPWAGGVSVRLELCRGMDLFLSWGPPTVLPAPGCSMESSPVAAAGCVTDFLPPLTVEITNPPHKNTRISGRNTGVPTFSTDRGSSQSEQKSSSERSAHCCFPSQA